MLGTTPTGTIPGAIISAVAHEGLTVTVNGRPARLAIINEDGQIVASGPEVAREAKAVANTALQNMWKGKGWLRELSQPIPLNA
jgi:hypothetical protein